MTNLTKEIETQAEISRRLGKLKDLYVRTAEIDQTLKDIHQLRTTGYRGLDEQAWCYLVLGPTSTGKSRLLATYCNRPDAKRNGLKTPVLRFSVPPAITNVLQFYAALLGALGTEPLGGLKKDMMERRIIRQLEEREVELILIDEIQHFVDQKQGHLAYWGGDAIKTLLLDGAKVPVVLTGIPAAKKMLTNTQLDSRAFGIFELYAHDWDIALQRRRFLEAISAFELAARFPQKYGLAKGGISERIHRATGGVIGKLSRLITKSVEVGIEQGRDGIDQNVLAVAYAKLASAGPVWTNVFEVDVLPPINVPDESRTTKLHKRRAA